MGWGIHRSNGSRSVGWTFGWSKEWSFQRKFSRTWSVIISVVFILFWVLFVWLSSGGDHDQRVEDRLAAVQDSMAQTDEDQYC